MILDASEYQMMRGGSLIFSAIFSTWFLKRKLDLHHYAGLVFTFIGLMIITLNIPNNKQYKQNMIFIGIIITILSLIMDGIYYVTEERIFQKYYMDPWEIIGTEGFIGMVITLIIGLLL